MRLLLFPGIDTTRSAIGIALWHRATHAADCRRLAAAPGLIQTAVEEFLRAYVPVVTARDVAKETTIDSCHLKQGGIVTLPLGAANRDPEVLRRPDDVLSHCADSRRAAFGLGVRRRIGSRKARPETATALREWLRAIPEFSLAPNAAATWSAGIARGPRTLPLTVAFPRTAAPEAESFEHPVTAEI